MSIVDYQEEALGKVEESSESEEYEDYGDENDSDEQDDDSEVDFEEEEEDDDDDDNDEFDDEFENKFKAFLRTPEGMALVLVILKFYEVHYFLFYYIIIYKFRLSKNVLKNI